jgi:hypothetical protein
MGLVFSFADRISVPVSGALLVEGLPEEVARDPRIKAVYLGDDCACCRTVLRARIKGNTKLDAVEAREEGHGSLSIT